MNNPIAIFQPSFDISVAAAELAPSSHSIETRREVSVPTVRVRKFLSGNWDENSGGSLMRKSELNSVTRVSPRSQQKHPQYNYSTQLCALSSPFLPSFRGLSQESQTSKSYISVGL